ncbi:MAG: glycoside hydrolase family 3 N-terminal domain-containing protein [Arthrobacter sp.]|uniref:glycoside hydrolase family 3 N-terminal domain-containing protein n=1 Tax=Arthrobacter sp. TaxID=1667 RepID=UPI00347DE126
MAFLTAALALSACTPGSPAGGGDATPGGAPASSAPGPTAAPEPERTSWGPLVSDVRAARAAVAEMSLPEKTGQVFVDYYTGTDPAAELATARRLHLGGVIVMGDNVPLARGGDAGGGAAGEGAAGGASGVDTKALARVTARFHQELSAGRDWPGIVSVDQEGGMVARLKSPLTEWPTPMAFGAAGDPELTEQAQRAMDAELAGLGFTVNFSPDADVTIGPADPVIGARSFSSDPDAAADHTVAAVRGALAAGVLPAVKHFPGHGSVTTDSHVGLPAQDARVQELRGRDWVPFERSIEAGAPMVMLGHIAVDALEPGVPSSLSAASYKALRGLGFEGVAVTDALNMGAVEQSAPGGGAAVEALAAGADLLLMPTGVAEAHAAVVAAVESGEVPESRLDQAATRVVAMMMWQGRMAEDAGDALPGDGADTALAAARASVTVVSGACSGPLVGDGIRIVGGTAADRDRLGASARGAGLGVGSGTLVTLLGGSHTPGSGDVVVALDAPWGLASSSAQTRIALYGRAPESFEALVDVLLGDEPAPGTLPADVGDYPAGTGCGPP